MARVVSVFAPNGHGLGKTVRSRITLIAGEGVVRVGDAISLTAPVDEQRRLEPVQSIPT